MKPNSIRVFWFWFAVLFTSPAAWALEVVIGVSPYLPDPERSAVHEAIKAFALKTAPLGSHIKVYDAWTLELEADLSVPPQLTHDMPSARKFNMTKGFAALDRWFKSLNSLPGGQPNDGKAKPPADSTAIRAPEFLAKLSELRGEDLPARTAIILCGSPFYLSPDEPSFSMADSRYPSDGHLKLPRSKSGSSGTSVNGSVYGTADFPNGLADLVVHWCTLRNDIFSNELHGDLVKRWWALYVKGMGGRLVTFSSDLSETLRRAVQGKTSEIRAEFDSADSKVTMHTALPRSLPADTPQPDSQSDSSAANPRSIKVLPVGGIPFAIGRTGIGIAWGDAADVDLWVRPSRGAEEINFKHQNSPEATLVSSDIRQANVGKIYEFVEFTKPQDLDTLEKLGLDVWINYFDGKATSVSGQIVFVHEGRAWAGEFKIDAGQGDRAAGRNNRPGSQHWTHVSLRDLKEDASLVAQPPKMEP